MGVAAYNRGSRAISQRLDAEQRAPEFVFMDHLNSLAKYADCGQPTEPLQFVHSRQVWWVETVRLGAAGFGYYYPTLREAVRRWNVSIRGYANGIWIGDPLPERLAE